MQKRVLLAILLALVLSGCAPAGKEIILSDTADAGVSVEEEGTETADLKEAGEEASFDGSALIEEENAEPASIFVYVCGAVNSPGVYELPKGSRIVDAVQASGGFLDTADETFVNLAAKLEDGVKLLIPTVQEVADAANGQIESFDKGDSSFAGTEQADSGGLININLASKDELTTLPGIGNATAEKIVSYREQHGSFKTKEDIMKVSGIKDKLFSKIKDQITV